MNTCRWSAYDSNEEISTIKQHTQKNGITIFWVNNEYVDICVIDLQNWTPYQPYQPNDMIMSFGTGFHLYSKSENNYKKNETSALDYN